MLTVNKKILYGAVLFIFAAVLLLTARLVFLVKSNLAYGPSYHNKYTFTTYYPAPYGKYSQLLIGDGSTDPALQVSGPLFVSPSLEAYTHVINPALFIDPKNPKHQAPVTSAIGIYARSEEVPVSNTWTGYDFKSCVSSTEFIGARIAAQFPNLGSDKLDTDLLFLTLDESAGSLKENMRINSNGNVGIGTKSALQRLTVFGNIKGDARLDVTGSERPAFIMKPFSNPEWDSGVTIGTISDWSDSSREELTIKSGNVGIGITNPKSALDVNGKLSVSTDGAEYKELLALNYNNAGNPRTLKIIGEWAGRDIGADNGFYFAQNGGAIGFGAEGNKATLLVSSKGNVGISIADPKRALHISDVMRLEPRSSEPSNPQEGDIYYDKLSKTLRVFNGSEWKDCF